MLQPALQIISKVLFSNHPFWRAMLDIYKLSPIDTDRIPVRPPDDDGNYPLALSREIQNLARRGLPRHNMYMDKARFRLIDATPL